MLGIDPGERRIGLAVSDALEVTAQGLETFDRRSNGDLVEHIAALVQRYDVGTIVVGNPLRTSGEAGESSLRARALAERLRARLNLTVTLWDERFSSEEAGRVLKGTRAKKGAIDRLAAVLILQSYLDYRGRR